MGYFKATSIEDSSYCVEPIMPVLSSWAADDMRLPVLKAPHGRRKSASSENLN